MHHLQTFLKTLDVMTWMCYYNNSSILYLLFSEISKHGGLWDMAENKNIKSRCHAIMLYPDNPYHVQLLDYLKKTYDGFYICHESGSDNYSIPQAGYVGIQHDEKKHLHVVLQFKNPRTSSGFIKSLPTVRYYKPLQVNNYDEKFKQQLFTVYDVSYLDIPLEEIIQPIISHTEIISDIYAYAHYLFA